MTLSLDIIDSVTTQWPWITGYIVVIVIAVLLSRFYYTRFKKVEDKIEHADCKANKEHIGSTKKIITDINKSIDRIEKILIAKDPELLNMLSETNSPRQLNSMGAKLFTASGADKILESFTDILISKLQERNPTTAYDVEQTAYSLLLEESSEAWFVPIKNYIYNNPVFEDLNLSIETIAFVMSLPLRNIYLEKHPEINTDDKEISSRGVIK